MKKEYDLKKLKKRPTKVRVDSNATKIHISLRLEASVLASLKSDAEKLGIPYQTHLGSILYQYANKELISKNIVEMAKILRIS
jgi:predicted DNA binding CopG/RHH family protein